MATITCDVLVVGGGIIGASTAWLLGLGGVRTLVCDAGVLGGESSWAGAGMLVPGSEYDEPGAEFAMGLDSLAGYPAFVERLVAASGLHVDFSLPGSLELAAGAGELERLCARARRQQESGIRAELVPAADLQVRLGGRLRPLAGAVFYPGEGQVDPRTVMAALRIALDRAGVALREHAAATRLAIHSGGVEADLAGGDRVSARYAVLAAGAWSTAIEGLPALPAAYPVKGHLVGYPLSPGTLPHILRFGHTYVVQRITGYTIAGATVEDTGFSHTVDDAIAAELAQHAHALAPGLLPEVPADRWTGLRPAVHAPLPQIGRYQDSPLWLAYGHYRNGILLAPGTAERLSQAIISSW